MDTNTTEGKRRILKTAEKMFTELGYGDVSIRDIAHACDMTNAALYYYFPNKAELFKEVMLAYADSLRETLLEASGGSEDPKERLVRMMKAYADKVAQHRSSFMVAKRSLPAQSPGEATEMHHQLYHRAAQPFAEVLDSARQQGLIQPESGVSQVALLIGMLHGAIRHAGLEGDANLSLNEIQQIVDVFWRGIARMP
jgi:AcrR family transcriptional regulator